jgi:hypothetical protein
VRQSLGRYNEFPAGMAEGVDMKGNKESFLSKYWLYLMFLGVALLMVIPI